MPQPKLDGHKYSRGVVGLRTGSAAYPGAALLSVAGAMCGLAGMVRYDGGATDAVISQFPEVVPGGGQLQAWVTGCGGGPGAGEALARCLRDNVPVVVDAEAIRQLSGPLAREAVVTPHAGELADLLGADRAEVEARQLYFVRQAAVELQAVVLLKGRRTLIAEPSGAVLANHSGTPWLATAGAGDVLAGLIGSLLAAGLEPMKAAGVAAWLHGEAAVQLSVGGPLRAAQLEGAIRRLVGNLQAGRVAGT